MRGYVSAPTRARLAWFAQSQSPILATFLLVGVASLVLEVPARILSVAVLGYALVGIATIVALLVPWEQR